MAAQDTRARSRQRFERDIVPILDKGRRKTRERTVDVYAVFRGVLYVLEYGCPWRQLPPEFPNWRTCYGYFQQWATKDAHGQSPLDAALTQWGWRGATVPWSARDAYGADAAMRLPARTPRTPMRGTVVPKESPR